VIVVRAGYASSDRIDASVDAARDDRGLSPKSDSMGVSVRRDMWLRRPIVNTLFV
jgi:hypothetical protein